MSVPPQGPPPGGYYYTPPPPPNQGNSNGCLKAAGITCGVLLVLGILLAVVIGFTVKKQFDHPDLHSPVGVGIAAGRSALDASVIRGAIVKYHAKTGHYPNNLTSLIPEYLPSAASLHSPLDAIDSPDHVSWQYIKPKEGGNPHTPVLRLRYELNIKGANQNGQQRTGEIVINLDGTSPGSPGGYSNSQGGYSGGQDYPQSGQ